MMHHKKKVVFIIVGGIALATLAGIIVLYLAIEAFKPRIETAASNALDMDVRIKGRLDIAFFSGLGLSLKNVTVENRGFDLATIEKIRILLQPTSLLRFQIKINQIDLVRPVVSIIQLENGTSNIKTSVRALKETLPAVKKMTISEGSLVYTNQTSGDKFEVNGADIRIIGLLYDRAGGTDFFKSISFTGDIRCNAIRINNFSMMNLRMSASVAKGMLVMDPTSMNIFDGTGSGSIRVDTTGTSPHYTIIYTLERAEIEELIQQYTLTQKSKQTIEGPIDVSADMTAKGKNVDEMRRSLGGTLSLHGENLTLHNMDIDDLIKKYQRSQNFNLLDVGAFLLAGPLGPVLTKGYNFTNLYHASLGGNGIIRKLVSIWDVQNGRAEAQDVALASNKQRIAVKGSLDIINERFVDVTIAAIDERGCAVYSENVQGPFDNPQIEKDSILKSMVGSVLNPLENAWNFIQGKECTPFYSGSVAQPED